MPNTIHEQSAANQIWHSDYFGPFGAIAQAKFRVEEVHSIFGSPLNVDFHKNLTTLQANLSLTKMRYMSTMFSALSHCASQVKEGVKTFSLIKAVRYGYRGFIISFDLGHLVQEVGQDKEMLKALAPGERDVLIASLLAVRPCGWLHLEFWYKKEAVDLIVLQIRSLPNNHPASFFAKGRALSLLGQFSKGEEDLFRMNIAHALQVNCPNGTCPTLSWSDVARLARMVGDNDRAQYAAKQDGTPEALLKAGVK